MKMMSLKKFCCLSAVMGLAACSPSASPGPDSDSAAGPGGAESATRQGAGGESAAAEDGNGTGGGSGGSASGPAVVPLFSPQGEMQRPVLEDTGDALISRFGDRGRDRHAREDAFAAYDHYLSHYWEHRTVAVEVVDTVGRAANGSVTFSVTTEYKLSDNEAELRFFYYGQNTVAEYFNNGVMTAIDDLHYRRSVTSHGATHQPLQVGDLMEFELSQFLDDSVEEFGGRANYYGTTYLYVVGVGLVPWQAETVLGTDACPCNDEDSFPIPEKGWLGGLTTLPYQYSNEPRDHFMQMATNLAGDNAQPFVLGRRLVHTEFVGGTHSENGYAGGTLIENPDFVEQQGKLGPHYVHESCDGCHLQNSRALPPSTGTPLEQYVFLMGDGQGEPTAAAGRVLQLGDRLGAAEGSVTLSGWQEEDGLRRPQYSFTTVAPEQFSARIAPQLVGMGLLEAIPEEVLLTLADPDDLDGDGISGRVREVLDPVTGDLRMGRFGWKAAQASVRYQIAGALNTDMGVMTSVYPEPDCGSSQSDCQPSGAELDDEDLDHLEAYISLLGIRARRDLEDPEALQGEELFSSVGCGDCHLETVRTSPYATFAEVRDQVIHPYTDLLLHDMGAGLTDTLDEDGASGAEWRTPPLWGVGLTSDVSEGEAYLHDGRARSLDEAIRWHGGEGAAARDAYEALPDVDRTALITFLRTL